MDFVPFKDNHTRNPMWIGVLWAGLWVAMWITHVGGKFCHGLLEKSLKKTPKDKWYPFHACTPRPPLDSNKKPDPRPPPGASDSFPLPSRKKINNGRKRPPSFCKTEGKKRQTWKQGWLQLSRLMPLESLIRITEKGG